VNPVATNFSSQTGQALAVLAEASSIARLYAAHGEQTEESPVNLHNNPDVADSNAQRTLPNTLTQLDFRYSQTVKSVAL